MTYINFNGYIDKMKTGDIIETELYYEIVYMRLMFSSVILNLLKRLSVIMIK